MQIDKVKMARGDQSEILKLARNTIRKSTPTDRYAHPLVSQFFDSDPSGVRELDLDTLLGSMAGADDVVREKAIELLNEWKKTHMGADDFYDYSWPQAFEDANKLLTSKTKVPRPKFAGPVTQIGSGAGSGWTPPGGRIVPATGAKAATGRLEKALLNNRLAKGATPSAADMAILTATLKSIVHELLGLSVENFDPNTLKTKLTAAIKARPDLARRLAKALNTA